MDAGNRFLGTERIGKLMRQYAVPCIISLLVGALYNIVDQIFIANASYLGSYGNAVVLCVVGSLVLTAALSVWYLLHMKVVVLKRSSFRPEGKLIPKFLVLGLTSFLAQISLVVSMAAVQNMCMKYGAQDPVFGQPEYAQIPLAVQRTVPRRCFHACYLRS